MFRNARLACVLLLCLSFSAVAKEPLAVHVADQQAKPEPGKALVLFMRPSSVGFAVASSVYDAPDEDTRFIGVVRSKQKMAYQAEPGKALVRFLCSDGAGYINGQVIGVDGGMS